MRTKASSLLDFVFKLIELHRAAASGHEPEAQSEETFELVVVHLRDVHARLDRRPGFPVGAREQVAGILAIHDLQEEVPPKLARMLAGFRGGFVNRELLTIGADAGKRLLIVE